MIFLSLLLLPPRLSFPPPRLPSSVCAALRFFGQPSPPSSFSRLRLMANTASLIFATWCSKYYAGGARKPPARGGGMQKAPCTVDSVQGALRWRQGGLVSSSACGSFAVTSLMGGMLPTSVSSFCGLRVVRCVVFLLQSEYLFLQFYFFF